MRRKTTEEFIEEARKIHGDKYDYSRVNYINGKTKVCIICPEHGEFWQLPHNHLAVWNQNGCPKCSIKQRMLTTETFVMKAREVHEDKYDYSKVNYIDNSTKVCIICPEHGEFWQSPHSHLSGRGCLKCGILRRVAPGISSTTEEFVKKARLVHGEKFDYSKVKYVNNRTKVCIIDSETKEEFWQTPNNHLVGKSLNKITTKTFIKKAQSVHGDKYDYSKVNYLNSKTKVCICCPEHGEFWQTPNHHLTGGCPKCARERTSQKLTNSTEQFIKKAKEIHGDIYDYSKVSYISARSKVCIICHEHGEFWQTPNDHLNGKGCPKCSESSLEKSLREVFERENIEFHTQYSWNWLTSDKNRKQRVDFYLPEFNCIVECQGIQHFKSSVFFDKRNTLEYRIMLDKNKKELCEQHGIRVLYYSNLGIEYPYEVYEDIENLIDEIKKINLTN